MHNTISTMHLPSLDFSSPIGSLYIGFSIKSLSHDGYLLMMGMVEWIGMVVDSLDGFNEFSPPCNDHL